MTQKTQRGKGKQEKNFKCLRESCSVEYTGLNSIHITQKIIHQPQEVIKYQVKPKHLLPNE